MANIVSKTDVRKTLLSFSVGEEMVIGERTARYANIYTIAKDLEKKSGRKYLVSIDGIATGTLVRRLA